MPGRIETVMKVVGIVFLLAVASFILLAKYYPPLRLYLFGGEIPVSINDIKFWTEKVAGKNYYRIYAKYLKCSIELPGYGHGIYFNDRIKKGGWGIFFDPEDAKIYGAGFWGGNWELYCLGEGRLQDNIFEPNFPEGTKFTFLQKGLLDIENPTAYSIMIYLPETLKKLEKAELDKDVLAEIIEGKDYTRPK